MADTYLTYPYEFQGGRKAIASQVNANFEAVKQYTNGINITIDELKTAISDLKSKPVREILDIFYSFSSVAPTGAYPLWTGETILYCKNLYPQFWKKINNLSALGNIKTVSAEEYEERLNKYGQCAAFYIDEINGHVRLPKITHFISGITDITQLSREEEAGLPNISGGLKNLVGYGSLNETGAFEGSAQRGLSIAYHQKGTSYADINFDASQSNEIYGKSDTVQPPAVRLCLYLQVANSFAEVSELDVHAVVEELQRSLAELESAAQTYQKKLQDAFEDLKDDVSRSDSIIKLKDVQVTADQFTESKKYAQYPLCADIVAEEAKEDLVPDVCFDLADAESGNYAPVADCAEGVVHIYAKQKPTKTLVIPSIVLE